MRGDRHRAGAERAHEQARARARRRARRRPRRRRTRAPRPRSCPRRRARARGRAGASGIGRRRAGGDEHGRLPVELGRQPPQRAQEEPQRARAPPGRRTRSASGLRAAARCDAASAPGRSTRSRAGKIRCISSRVASKRGGARVEAAEEQLDEAARHLGREHALGGRVERADVERARVAQRDRRRARRERLVDVDEVERRDASAPPRSCARCPAAARDRAAARAGERQQLADAEHAHAAVGVEQLAAADPPPRLAHELRDRATARAPRRGARRRPARRRARATKALTSCSSSQGYGVTWAMVRGSGKAASVAQDGRMVGKSRRFLTLGSPTLRKP